MARTRILPGFGESLQRLPGMMDSEGAYGKEEDSRPQDAAKRELINTGTDQRYVRRSSSGQFKESDDVGRSLVRDRATKARRKVKSGHGDEGDR